MRQRASRPLVSSGRLLWSRHREAARPVASGRACRRGRTQRQRRRARLRRSGCAGRGLHTWRFPFGRTCPGWTGAACRQACGHTSAMRCSAEIGWQDADGLERREADPGALVSPGARGIPDRKFFRRQIRCCLFCWCVPGYALPALIQATFLSAVSRGWAADL